MQLTAPPPPDDSEEGAAALNASSQPTAGVLVDTLKALNPGVVLFSYPDAKKPGQVKLRAPYTAWSAVGAGLGLKICTCVASGCNLTSVTGDASVSPARSS